MLELNELIGLLEKKAINYISSYGYSYRITKRDDKLYPIKMDHCKTRINLQIENGLVTKADIG